MKWFAICLTIAFAVQPGLAWAQPGSRASAMHRSQAEPIRTAPKGASIASPIKDMSYPSASLGMILPARLLNAIRIGGDTVAVPERKEIAALGPSQRCVSPIIGEDFE